MLDERTEQMLRVASTLTAADLDSLRGTAPSPRAAAPAPVVKEMSPPDAEPASTPDNAPAVSNRGEYERQRTRESKVSTECLGHQRQKHNWWPVGTELVGQFGSDVFTAEVIENPQVKSGRSIRITSGPATGEVCITPTRAALRATESYRQAHNVGRAGGVTNGWTFWRART